MKDSTPGPDAIRLREMQAVLMSEKVLLTMLVDLFKMFERQSSWPASLCAAVISLIPKDNDGGIPGALDLRPVTLTSVVYRLWARIRAVQLTYNWARCWQRQGLGGGLAHTSAEGVLMEIALECEAAVLSGARAGGIAVDLKKAFDLIPLDMLAALAIQQGAPVPVIKTWRALYHGLSRRFKYGQAVGDAFEHHGGLLQGCPLSMVLLASMINIWIAGMHDSVPAASPKAYVDDMSIVAVGKTKRELCETLEQAFVFTRRFLSSIGAEISLSKTFTFGDEYKILGGSLVHRSLGKVNYTDLYLKRRNKWQATIEQVRKLPVSFEERAMMIQRTRAQWTYGMSAHSAPTKRSCHHDLLKLRACVMRALMRKDRYNVSPILMLTVIAPPGINPLMAHDYDSLMAFRRLCQDAGHRETLKLNYVHGWGTRS